MPDATTPVLTPARIAVPVSAALVAVAAIGLVRPQVVPAATDPPSTTTTAITASAVNASAQAVNALAAASSVSAPPPSVAVATVATPPAEPAVPVTTAPPPPPPEAAPPPEPAPSPPPDDGRSLEPALAESVPGDWLAAIPATLRRVPGFTSWAHTSDVIDIADAHFFGPWDRLRFVIAHEFGHLIAFHYGTQAWIGAPPDGWPAGVFGSNEVWANCVAVAFTGVTSVRWCPDEARDWTAAWLSAGPGAHPVTG